MTPPERYKRAEDLTVDEILELNRTGELPETDEYRTAVRDTLERAGLDVPDAYADEPEGNDADVEHHLKAIHGHRRRKTR